MNDENPSLLEQFTECYYGYTKDLLTRICQKEQQVREIVDFLKQPLISEDLSENELETVRTQDSLELMSDYLDFILSLRFNQEQKSSSSITVKAYKNSNLVQRFHSTYERIITSDELFNLNVGYNSCSKIPQ